MNALVIIGWALQFLAFAGVLYAIIRFAIVHALRQARHEARIEQHVPRAATWLKGEERRLLDVSNSSHEKV